ncbi:MAG: hexose kinase [Gemmatimonadota bacterium]|jgi:1-phosphofructokinase family hexose kinase
MIVTLTPNPSLDVLFQADRLVWDDANRLAAPRRRPGGQGINVARAARELGADALAVAPLGGAIGTMLRGMLETEGTPLQVVDIAGETRLFVGARESDTGRNLLLNPRGSELGVEEVDALAEATLSAVGSARAAWLACCGSVPPGVADDFYARLGREARARGVAFVPDCDGESLRRAAEAGCDLLVPNDHEAGRLLGRKVRGVEDAAAAARGLLHFGPRWAAITLGADGAVAATARGAWHAVAPDVSSGSAVGAGDAFLAAMLVAFERGAEAPEGLRQAVAAGTATLLGTDAALLRRTDVDSVLHDVQLRRVR